MRDAIALTADIVTIVGVLALLAFLLNHPVTRRLGVWAGALRGRAEYEDPWLRPQQKERRKSKLWRWRQAVTRPLLCVLSMFGGETRQPMRLHPMFHGATDPATMQRVLASTPTPQELQMLHLDQVTREQVLMQEALGRIGMRRWRREHRWLRCDNCNRRLRGTPRECPFDCSIGFVSDKKPKHFPHTCNDCAAKREAAADAPAEGTATHPQIADPSPPEPQAPEATTPSP